MGLSFGKQDDSGCVAELRLPMRRRTSSRRYPQCEALESRRLLSRAASALPSEGYLTPGAGEVAKAQQLLSSMAGPAFQTYASELQKLEQSSGVSRAQFARLANDLEEFAEDLDTSDELTGEITSEEETQQFDLVQDAVDQSFVAGSYSKSQWNALETDLANGTDGISGPDNADQILSQMKAIAREARVTAAQNQQLTADQAALDTALGSHTQSDLGGDIPRNIVVVYYEGQLNRFVHQ
jgi:dGTP triphosphohydrolase